MKHRMRMVVGSVIALSFLGAACGSDDSGSDDTTAAPETTAASTDTTAAGAEGSTPADCTEPVPVKLQLQWYAQAQFAGYYAAADQGFYEAQCLDVEIIELPSVDVVPQDVLANGEVDFALAWVPKALASREAGANIVDIAQVFQRSGTLQVSFADAGITTPADFAGKTVGNWGFGNEFEVFAGMTDAGLDPATDVTNVQQDFNMNGLLSGDIDAAEAMTYNEYAQVLEAENPATGELYTPEDFSVISYEEVGVGMLQDAIWADGSRLDDPAYQDMAVKFVTASLQGWAYCRDEPQACTDIVLTQSPVLGASHQLWQMNEINKLIWPSPDGVGIIDPEAWDRTVTIAQETKNLEGSTVLTAAPDEGSWTNDIVGEALTQLEALGVDITGAGYAPIEVTLNAGGE